MRSGMLVPVVAWAMASAGCGDGSSGSSAQGGAAQGGAAQGGAAQGGAAQGGAAQGGNGGEGGGAQGGSGGGAQGAACAQCAIPPAGSQCATYDFDCNSDEGGCKVWRLCVDGCLSNDFTADCFQACKDASAASEALFSAVLGCICNACPAVCSPMCG